MDTIIIYNFSLVLILFLIILESYCVVTNLILKYKTQLGT